MRFKIKILPSLIIGFVLLMANFSCKKFIQVPPPQTQLVTASVFSNNASATAAQTVIYSEMESSNPYWTYSIPLLTGFSADELTNYATTVSIQEFYTNSLNATDNMYVQSLWTAAYNWIYQANAVIAGLQSGTGISPSVKQQLTGEAEFIRAFWHFYLVNLYGDVPLITSTNYKVNATAGRTQAAQVYQQIVADLLDAQNLLSSNYVDASDTTMTTDRVRPTKWAAAALLARVYLYTGDYPDAQTQATTVINNSGLYGLCANLDSVFLKNSKEAIWQLGIPLPATMNTPEGGFFILTAGPSGTSGIFSNCASLSSQWLNAVEPGDLRRKDWVDSLKSGTNFYYYPYKYKVQTGGTTISEYSMVLRLSEQYLIRAEAEAERGNLTSAASDLNVVRSRAGLPNTTAGDQPSLLSAILHERQIELFSEWGHRWLDLKRTGAVDTVMPGVTSFKSKGGSWNTDWQLYPIPQSERTADPNLSQNPGY